MLRVTVESGLVRQPIPKLSFRLSIVESAFALSVRHNRELLAVLIPYELGRQFRDKVVAVVDSVPYVEEP